MLIFGKAVYKDDHQINSANMWVPIQRRCCGWGYGPGFEAQGLSAVNKSTGNRQAPAASSGTRADAPEGWACPADA
jgi:hypothetical protein